MTLDTLSPLTKFLRIGERRPGSLQAVSRQLCPTSAEPRGGNHERAIAGAMIATRRTYGLSRLVGPTARWPGTCTTRASGRQAAAPVSAADPSTESLPPARIPRLPAELFSGLLVRGPARGGHL